jgi:hypothetical protein
MARDARAWTLAAPRRSRSLPMRPATILLAAAMSAAILVPGCAAASAIDTDAPGRETRASATEYIILLLGGSPAEREEEAEDAASEKCGCAEGTDTTDRSN